MNQILNERIASDIVRRAMEAVKRLESGELKQYSVQFNEDPDKKENLILNLTRHWAMFYLQGYKHFLLRRLQFENEDEVFFEVANKIKNELIARDLMSLSQRLKIQNTQNSFMYNESDLSLTRTEVMEVNENVRLKFEAESDVYTKKVNASSGESDRMDTICASLFINLSNYAGIEFAFDCRDIAKAELKKIILDNDYINDLIKLKQTPESTDGDAGCGCLIGAVILIVIGMFIFSH